MKESAKLGLIVAVVAAAWTMPIAEPRVQGAILEAFAMLHEYARDHILLCLVPAFFALPAIYFLDASGGLLGQLQGEVTADATRAILFP